MNALIALSAWAAKGQAGISNPNYKSESGVKKVLSKVEELLKLQNLRDYHRKTLNIWKKVISNINYKRIDYNKNPLGVPWLGTEFIIDHSDVFMKESPNNLIMFTKTFPADKIFKLSYHSCGETKRLGNFITSFAIIVAYS